VTFLAVEAGGSKQILNHGFPNCTEASDDMFTAKGSSLDALSYFTSLDNMVDMLHVFIAIGCKTNAKGALSLPGADVM
jgi:hypothetical protein